nr:hypothetical protein [Tanacetum cinerariifolium]
MEAPPSIVDGHHRATHRTIRIDLCTQYVSIRIHHGGKFQRYLGRMYVSGRVDIFDMVDIDLFTVVALNMMVLKLGYTGESELMFYTYLRPLTSLDEGLYALACEEDVRCLAILVRSFKLIEVYIKHGVTVLDSYLREPRFMTTLEDITNEPAGSIATNRTEKMLLLTWHESSEATKKPVCDSVTPSSLPQHDSSTHCKDSVCESITPRCMPDCILTPLTDEYVITYTQLSGVHGVDTQSHVIDDVMWQLSFDETELDGEAGFAEVAGSGVESSELIETQSELPVSEEPDVGHTQEPILAEVSLKNPLTEVSTQEPIVAEVSTEAPILEEVGTQEFSVEDVIIKDYFSFGEDGEDAKHGTTDDDDDGADQYFLVDEENEIVEPDVNVYLFGISMDLPFDNIGITNLVSDNVLEGEDVYVINANGFDSDPSNDEERNYRKRRRKLKLYKNDSVRLRARCEGKVHVFTMSQGTRPTDLNRGMEAGPSGSSGPTTRSRKMKNTVRVNPDILVKAVQDQLQRKLEVQISMSKAFRAKAKAEREIRGDHICSILCLETMVFQRIYVCLGALKLGFRACKRDMLGLDGAFMKGPFPGQVLVAVGLDSNNGIYLLAYALVEAETKSSWCWFLQCLGDDIDLHPNLNFTFIGDRQKTMNPKAHEWLNKIPAKHWARSHFPGRAKSDLLLNNICEVFNGKIVGGRDRPVITLLEYIREYCMKRIVNVQGVIDKCTGPLTPTATRIMESIKKEAQLMKVQWNGANKYQISGSLGDQCVVDVVSMTCSCRKWELTGIPCLSATAGEGGASDPGGSGVASQGSSHTRWTRRRVQTKRISPQKELPLNLQVNYLPVLKFQ